MEDVSRFTQIFALDAVDCLSLVLRLTEACFKISVLKIMVTDRGQPEVSQARCDVDIYISDSA